MKKYFLIFILASFVSLPAMAADTAEDKIMQASITYCFPKPGMDSAQTAEGQGLKEMPPEAAKAFGVERAFIISDFVILGTRSQGACSIFVAKLDYDNFWKVTDFWYGDKPPFKLLKEEEDQGLVKTYKGTFGEKSILVVARARKNNSDGSLQGLITVGQVANE